MEPISIDRARIFKRDNWTCLYCGASGIQNQAVLHADHLMPFSLGGSNEASNMVTACAACNLQKKDSVLESSDYHTLKGIVWNRNIDKAIPQDACVRGVRTKANGVQPQRGYSLRLSDEEASYCEERGGTVSKFIKELIRAHKAGTDAEKLKEKQSQSRVFVVKRLLADRKAEDKTLEEEAILEEKLWNNGDNSVNELMLKNYLAKIKEEERQAEKKKKGIDAERIKKIRAEVREDRQQGRTDFQPVYPGRRKVIAEANIGMTFDEEVQRATVSGFDPDEYIPE